MRTHCSPGQLEFQGFCGRRVEAAFDGGRQTIVLEQKDHVVAFFVVYECSADGDELCVVEASDPVAVSKCSGELGLSSRDGIHGTVRLKCKDGIDVSAPAFGLSTESQGMLRSALPDLDRKSAIEYRDKAGEEE